MEAFTIGRAPDNSLVIDDPQVSRYHARLYKSAGNWVITDLNSTHGTAVNGKKVDGPVALKPSDVITVSDVKLYFDGQALLSAKGKKLLSLATSISHTGIASKQGGHLQKQRLAGMSVKPAQHSNTPLVVSISLIVFLFIAMIIVSTGRDEEIPEPYPVAESYQPRPVFEYSTIPFDGGEYTGWLKDGVPHGQGTLTYFSFSRSGAFVNLHLNRRLTDKMYVGEWKDGLKHGYGKMTYPDGRVEEGYWRYGFFVGQSDN